MAYINGKEVLFSPIINMTGGGSADLSNYYTKSEVDDKFEGQQELLNDFNTDIADLFTQVGDISTALDEINAMLHGVEQNLHLLNEGGIE